MKTTLQHPNSAGPTKNKHGHLSATKNEATGKNLPSQQVVVQPELELTQPGDSYEQEADSMADFVMRMPSADHRGLPRSHSSVTSALPPTISRQANSGSGVAVDKCTADGILASQGGGHTLPDGLRSRMEGGFGCDFSAVRLHTDSHAAELCTSLQAKAFTYGNDIYFNQGRYNPHSAAGQHLIAHELTHTLQQSGKIGRQQEDKEIEDLRKYFENFAHIKEFRGDAPDVRFRADKQYPTSPKQEGKPTKTRWLVDCDVYVYEAIHLLTNWNRGDLKNESNLRYGDITFQSHPDKRSYVGKVTFDKAGEKPLPTELFDPKREPDKNQTLATITDFIHERQKERDIRWIKNFYSHPDREKSRIEKVTFDKAGTKPLPTELFDPKREPDKNQTLATIDSFIKKRLKLYSSMPILSPSQRGKTQLIFYPIMFKGHLAMIFKLNGEWYLQNLHNVERVGIVEGGAGKPQDISNALKRIQELHNYVFKYYYFMGVKYNMPASLLKKNP